jgi:rRNA maturation endonuclease Nob1
MAASEFEEACDAYQGFCTNCRRITTDTVEPDAREYECESCGERAVYGAEEALFMDLIEIIPVDDDE